MTTSRFCFTWFALLVLLLAWPAFAELGADPQASGARSVVLQLDGSDAPLKGSDAPLKGIMPVDLTLDDGTSENTIGDAGQFIWFNRFTPAPADFPFQLEEISVVFGNTLVNIGDAIELLVYTDTDGDDDPGTGSVLVANIAETVQANDGVAFSVYTLGTPVMLDGPGDVLIGVVNRYGSEGFNDFPASLDQTATQGRSWAASYLAGDAPPMPPLPADEQFDTIDSFGFPGNWIVRGAGTTVDIVLPPPTDVPVLSAASLAILALLLVGIATFVIWRRS